MLSNPVNGCFRILKRQGFPNHCRRPNSSRNASTWQSLPRAPTILALALIGGGSVGLSLGIYTYYQIPTSPYPEVVTKHIRKALYYEGAAGDPKSAIHYYLQALEEATAIGLDQTSDEMTGLKIKIGAVYENAGRLDSAIRVYSGLLNEIKVAMRSSSITEDEKTRLLRRALGTSVKIGELSSQYQPYKDKAEPAYVWALETMLKESARRKNTNWLDPETVGGIYEAAATFYYDTERPNLALPLYLKALESLPEPVCHTITIMNNIASAISSQSSSIQVQENAKEWAMKARDLVVSASSEDEQRECHSGRCSASLNLGVIAEKSLKLENAAANFTAAMKCATVLETKQREAIQALAKAGLKRVEAKHN